MEGLGGREGGGGGGGGGGQMMASLSISIYSHFGVQRSNGVKVHSCFLRSDDFEK